MTLSAKEGRERTRSVFDFRLSPRRPTGRPFVNVHNRVPHSSMAAENRIMSKSPVIKFNPDSWLFPSPHRTPLKWKLSSRLVMAAVGSLSKIWIGKFRRIWRERLRERERVNLLWFTPSVGTRADFAKLVTSDKKKAVTMFYAPSTSTVISGQRKKKAIYHFLKN